MSATDRYNCQLASKGNTSTLQLTTEIWDREIAAERETGVISAWCLS